MQFKEIQEQFNKVISYSQEISEPNTDKLFADWLDAKHDFIEAMNGKLIWEWPETVYFELGEKEKNLRIDDFITMVADRYVNYSLAEFIQTERDGFFSNQVIEPYETAYAKIPKGMKLIKAFKFFEDDEKTLNDLQSAASMIIQEDKVEGTLCLSVHPLDFLSASENTHNWRSCHALDGEYRAGNLSYMVDKSTIMCYLKSKREEKLPDFPDDVPWNSKKWRVLLFMSDNWDMMFAGRQYPFSTDAGLNFIKDRIFPILHMGDWSPWLETKIKDINEKGIHIHFRSPYIPVNDVLVPMKELVTNAEGSLQFNDLLSSSCYDPVYAYKIEETFYGTIPIVRSKTRFKIGGQVNCCRCGHYPIELSESFMCNDCEMEYGSSDSDMFATCPCCGHRYIFDDGYWVSDVEETICPECADDYAIVCDNCGEMVYKENAVYNRRHGVWYCKWCNEDIKFDDDPEIEEEDE